MKLAINGGKPIRNVNFKPRRFYNHEEIKAELAEVIDSEMLSGYRGSIGNPFWGGEKVREVETLFERYLGQSVLAVNSCTSALQIACGAIGLKPGDEVIVTPYSMSCSATAPLLYGATPVFVDIEKDYFCIDPEKIEEKITDKTKAILIVDLFGQPFDVVKVKQIAEKYNLFIIEDSAQAIGSEYEYQKAGTFGDIGCFSFTQGKIISSGEGGFITTNNPDLYMKCALLRNHADAVISSMPEGKTKDYYSKMTNQVGFNMRMTEIEAVILKHQILNLNSELLRRKKNIDKLKNIESSYLKFAPVRNDCKHTYYVLPLLYDEDKIGVTRERFTEAIRAELQSDSFNTNLYLNRGVPFWNGYTTPLYKMPIFNYDISLPVAEYYLKHELITTLLHGFDLNDDDINDIVHAFIKVEVNIGELK